MITTDDPPPPSDPHEDRNVPGEARVKPHAEQQPSVIIATRGASGTAIQPTHSCGCQSELCMYTCALRCATPTHISLARVGIHQHQHHGQAMFLAVTPLSLNCRVSVELELLELQREPWSSHHHASCKLHPTRSRGCTTRIVDSVRPEVASKYVHTCRLTEFRRRGERPIR